MLNEGDNAIISVRTASGLVATTHDGNVAGSLRRAASDASWLAQIFENQNSVVLTFFRLSYPMLPASTSKVHILHFTVLSVLHME